MQLRVDSFHVVRHLGFFQVADVLFTSFRFEPTPHTLIMRPSTSLTRATNTGSVHTMYQYDIPVLHLNDKFWIKHRLTEAHYGQFKVFASDISLAFASHVANVPCFGLHLANVLQPCMLHPPYTPGKQDFDSQVFFAKSRLIFRPNSGVRPRD